MTCYGLHSGSLTGGDLGWVRNYLEENVPVDGSSSPPQILWTELREGLIRVVCANDHTKRWVEAQIAASGKGWTTGNKGLFRPPLKRYTTVMREGMTVARFPSESAPLMAPVTLAKRRHSCCFWVGV